MLWFNKKTNENRSKLDTIQTTVNTLFETNSNGERAIKSIDEYNAAAQTLASLIIEFLGGGDIVTVNGDFEYKFVRNLPGWELVSELQGSVQPYVEAAAEFVTQKANSSGNGNNDFFNFNSQSTDDIDFIVSGNNKKALGQALINLYKNPNVVYMPENICRIYKEITKVMKAIKTKTAIIATSCVSVALIGLGYFLKVNGNNKKKYHHDDKYDKYKDKYKDNYIDEYDEIVFVDESPLDDDIHVSVGDTIDNINKKFSNRLNYNVTDEFNF